MSAFPFKAARNAIDSLGADMIVGIYHGGAEHGLQTGKPLVHTNENIACRTLFNRRPID